MVENQDDASDRSREGGGGGVSDCHKRGEW